VDFFMHCNTSSPGTTITTTILQNCTDNYTTFGGWGILPNPLTGDVLAVHQSGCSPLAPMRVQDNTYNSGSTTQSVSITDNSANHVATIINGSGAFDRMVKTGCIKLGPTDSGASNGSIDYDGVSTDAGRFAVLQLNNGNCNGDGTGYGLLLETNPSGVVTKTG